MKIYIASSWKNQHAVEMLTARLREEHHEVLSFIENQFGESDLPFHEWMKTPQSQQSFEYDTTSAMTCDLVIYISPSGQDAAAECGMAYAKGTPIIGLWAKGEGLGLMQRMMSHWANDYLEVLQLVYGYANPVPAAVPCDTDDLPF